MAILAGSNLEFRKTVRREVLVRILHIMPNVGAFDFGNGSAASAADDKP